MSFLFSRRAERAARLPEFEMGSRTQYGGGAHALSGEHGALRHSVVWACLRLRADLVSTMPLDVFRKVPGLGIEVEVGKPAVLETPWQHGDGQPMSIGEWMHSTQIDLDRFGNAFGIITARDALGLPAQIALVSAANCTVRVRGGQIVKYLISGQEYDPREVWHERQFVLAGWHVGLSAVAHAALSTGAYLSAQEFAADWFAGKATPTAVLKNGERKVPAGDALAIKTRFEAAMHEGGAFVVGKDWDYQMAGVPAAMDKWLDAIGASNSDAARFYGVPGDLVDVAVQSGSITYASITQRNLQLLIMHLGPAIARREWALSRLTPNPRRVKLNADALLRMDPQTRASVLAQQIDKRITTVTEARALENRPPLTPEQIEEFDVLFGNRQLAAQKPAGTSPSE